MKSLLVILSLLCQTNCFLQTDTLTKEQLLETFEQIRITDQSHLKELEVRQAIFVENFNTIIGIIERQGFPYFPENKKNKKLNASIYLGIGITFTHILQAKPHLLLNQNNIELVKMKMVDQIKSDNTKKDIQTLILSPALRMFQYERDHDLSDPWTEEIEDYFYAAIRAWNIKLYPIKKS